MVVQRKILKLKVRHTKDLCHLVDFERLKRVKGRLQSFFESNIIQNLALITFSQVQDNQRKTIEFN